MTTLTLAALSLLALPLGPAPDRPAPPSARAQDVDPEYAKRLTEAGDDVAKLWALHEWCKERELRDLSKQTLQKILSIDTDHEEARKALGHRLYDGQWFESYSALSKYRREEEARMAEKGLVRFNDSWAPVADVPFLRMGWVKDEQAGWAHPTLLEQRQREADLRGQGWVQQGLTWVAPDEKARMDEGLWKCGEEWLPLDQANAFHAQLLRWWEVPGEHFTTLTTLPRKADGSGPLEWAAWWAESCYPDLVRAVGVEPQEKPHLLVLDSLDQYNKLAQGDQALGIPTSEVSGASSVYFAHFADAFFDTRLNPPMWRGMGVCYHEYKDEKRAPWGRYAVRHAAALSFLEQVDRSWEAVSQAVTNPTSLQLAAFWNEKRLPRWLHYGIASWCDRFARDSEVVENGDPWVYRAFALQQLRAGGPLDPLEQIFALNIDPNDDGGSERRIHQAGLLVSFMLDGNCAPVTAAHEELKKVFAAGVSTAEAVQALQQALTDNLPALLAYAGY